MGKKHEESQDANAQAQAAAQAPPQYAPPTPPAAPGGTADLDQLVQYHNQGVRTDEEFAAAKSKLLGL
jgi:hypothetical protein